MTSTIRIVLLFCLASLLADAVFAQDSLSVGANVNMVSGGSFPNGDPFQRQQNEPSVAYSSRNNLHLLSGANDYRAVDVPGLPGGRETGDSWLSYFWSTNGGATWKSTLIPGYPQDPACQSANPPVLCDYAAGADPVVRAGVNGMFYYSGIVFERSDPSRSAIFVSRFIDLNNDEGGDPIRYLDTRIIDANNDGSVFLDKSWIAVDIPRGTFPYELIEDVVQSDGSTVDQTVACGNIYVGYAAIGGEGDNLRSEIRMATSADCGNIWDVQLLTQPIGDPDATLNQGANIAIRPDNGDVHVVWRRFDTVESFLGISPTGCPASPASWEVNDDWPVSELTMGGVTYTVAQAKALLGTKHRGDESFKLAYEVIAAKLNLFTGGGDPVDGFNPSYWEQNLGGLIADAEAWFEDNPIGSDPKQGAKKDGKAIKKNIQAILQGSGTCSGEVESTTTGTTGETNAIVIASSYNLGEEFSAPAVIDESSTFDQGSTRFSFRTTAYPTIAVDADGRIYVAWAARGFATIRNQPSDGDARIVVSTSYNGTTWNNPYPIDEPGREGHQIKPSLLFAGGQLTLVYYDFRQDVSGIYEGFVIDLPQPDRLRHTVDVRVATAIPVPGMEPVFTDYSLISGSSEDEPVKPSNTASRYAFVAYGDASSVETLQVEYMVPNFPMFADGTTPFIGDYVDVAAPNLITYNDNGTWRWRFATDPGDVQVWQAVWSDNRDVRPPPDGDWSKYVAPIEAPQPSLFDPTVTIPSCNDVSFPDAVGFEAGAFYTGTRNQNVYSASISNGVIVAAPGNNRPLNDFNNSGAPLERSFVVYVQNTTRLARNFRLTLPSIPSGVEASFVSNGTVTTKDVAIPPYSSAVATVFASSDGSSTTEAIPVSVVELGGGTLAGSVLLNSDPEAPDPLDATLQTEEVHNPAILNPAILNPAILNASVDDDSAEFMTCTSDPAKCVLNPAVLNPAILNPAILNPSIFDDDVLNPAILNPAILNPAIFNPAILNPAVLNPAILNPAILNPAILNPAIFNPAILNPAVLNPAILNPAILNPAILNPAVLNPAILNPAILNPAILNPAVLNTTPGSAPQQVDVTFAIRNDGNATTAYDLDLTAPQLEGLDYELMVYRLNETPVTNGCELTTEAQQQLIFNQTDPLNNNLDGSFYLEPGQEVLVTFRVLPDVNAVTPANPVTTFVSNDLGGLVNAQPPNTDPASQPPADQFGPYVPGTPSSTFDTGADGWTIANDGNPDWYATGGNPGGYFRATDQGSGQYWYFRAPAPYLGDRSTYYGGELSYQLQMFAGSYNASFPPWVVLAGGGLTLIYDGSAQGAPGNVWTSFNVPLSVGSPGWYVATDNCWTGTGDSCGFSGATPPTPAQFQSVLANLDTLLIRGEYTIGGDSAGLDNVQLVSLTSITDIDSINLSTTTLTIDGPSASYTANLRNNTGGPLSLAVLQAYIEQPGASRAAGGLQLNCDTTGVLPPGDCAVDFSLGANNTTSAGSGTLVAGPATARFNLQLNGDVIDTFTVPITLQSGTSGTSVTITSVSPNPIGENNGFAVVRGVNLPEPSMGTAVVSDVAYGGTTTMNGFVFQSPSTTSAYWVRLPSGLLPPGFSSEDFTIEIQDDATSSNAFPITVSATPGTPIITNIFDVNFAPTSSTSAGSTIYVQADGIDTTGWTVQFTQDGNSWSVTPDQTNFAVSSDAIGLSLKVLVPALAPGSDVEIRVDQGGGFSAPVTLTVPLSTS